MNIDKLGIILLVLFIIISVIPSARNEMITSSARKECPMCLSEIPKEDYDEYFFAENVDNWSFYKDWLPENRDSYIVERETLHDLYVAAYAAGYCKGLTGEEDAQTKDVFSYVGDFETAIDWLEKLISQYRLE